MNWIKRLFFEEPYRRVNSVETLLDANISGIKPVAVVLYAKTPGMLGRPYSNSGISWYACREQFHGNVDLTKGREYYYVHAPNKSIDIANFIYNVENHLKLEEKSSFMYTDQSHICYIEVSPWWTDNDMRHSFFTICLRAALNWTRGNKDWLKVLNLNLYAVTTPQAVQRFLEGYTWYTGNIRGWHRQFTGFDQHAPITQQQLQMLLVRPRFTFAEKQRCRQEMAYYKWVNAGCPNGRSMEFWNAAVAEFRQAHGE